MVVLTVLPVALSVLVLVFAVLCGSGVVPRNDVAGIRLPSLKASDAAWERGHRAAILPAAVGTVLAVAGLVMVSADRSSVAVGSVLSMVGLLCSLGWGTAAAMAAAR